MLVFLAAAWRYKGWKNRHRNKDAKYDFPGFDAKELLEDTAPFKGSRPLSPDEVWQHCVLLADRQMFSRQVTREIKESKPYHFTLTAKGEALFDRLATAKYMGLPILLPMLDKGNAKVWSAFVVLALLARPKSDALTDKQIALRTGLTESAVKTGRRLATQGFMVQTDTGSVPYPGAQLLVDTTGSETQYCLTPDQWVLEDDDLTEALVALRSAPPDPEPLVDGTVAPPAKEDKGFQRIVLRLPEDQYEAFSEAVLGSSVEEYLMGIIENKIACALEERQKKAQLESLRRQQAELRAQHSKLEAKIADLLQSSS